MNSTQAGQTSASTTRTIALGAGGMTAILALSHGVNDMFTGMVPALLPGFQQRFGLEEGAVALLAGTFAFSSSFLGPFFGDLADLYGARIVAALAVAFTSVTLSLLSLVSDATLLLGLMALAGLGSAAFHPAGGTLIRADAGTRTALALGLFSAGGMLGYALGPIVVLWLVAGAGPEWGLWLILPGLFAAFLIFRLAPKSPPAKARPSARGLGWRLIRGPVGLLTAAASLNALVILAFTSGYPLWLVNVRGVAADSMVLGATLAVFALALAIGGIGGGLLAIKVRRELVVALTMIGAVVPLLLLFILEPGSLAYYATVAMAGLLTYASVPLLVHGAQELAQGRVGAASGMLFGLAGAVAAVLYIGLGWLQTSLGIAPVLGVAFAGLLPAAPLAYFTLKRANGHQQVEADPLSVACRCLAADLDVGEPKASETCECLDRQSCATMSRPA